MNYQETVEYLFTSTPVFEKIGAKAYKPGLDTMYKMDEHFGHPHNQYKCTILQEPTEKVHHPIHLLQSCRAKAIRSAFHISTSCRFQRTHSRKW